MITQNTNRLATEIARLPGEYLGKPRILALLSAWIAETQALENAMWSIYTDRLLQNIPALVNAGAPVADILNKLGAIVGQSRDGFDDIVYALLITARIQTNNASGQHEDILKIIELLIPNVPIYFKEYLNYPGAITIEPQGPVPWNPYFIYNNFLFDSKSAGVRYYFQWTQVAFANTFTFGSVYGTTQPNPLTQGWSSVYGPTNDSQIAGVISVGGA